MNILSQTVIPTLWNTKWWNTHTHGRRKATETREVRQAHWPHDVWTDLRKMWCMYKTYQMQTVSTSGKSQPPWPGPSCQLLRGKRPACLPLAMIRGQDSGSGELVYKISNRLSTCESPTGLIQIILGFPTWVAGHRWRKGTKPTTWDVNALLSYRHATLITYSIYARRELGFNEYVDESQSYGTINIHVDRVSPVHSLCSILCSRITSGMHSRTTTQASWWGEMVHSFGIS